MAFSIRFAQPEDLPEMYRISVRAHQENYTSLIPQERRADFEARYSLSPEREERYIRRVGKYLEDEKWLIWVAESEGKVVGYTLAYREDDHTLHKKGLFMNPDYQGEGIGTALFKTSLGAIETGEIDLSVIAANNRARHIYEKNGFEPAGRDPRLYFGAVRELMVLRKH
jgi:RimJ/RimL family protein N-acetyltransferase